MAKIPKSATGGDCYDSAGRYFMDSQMFGKKSNMVLVHGEVTGQGAIAGVKYGHAWVEEGDMVIDKSNGRDLKIPKIMYYALGHIHSDRVFKYTFDEFKKKVSKYKHWGPWDLKTEY